MYRNDQVKEEVVAYFKTLSQCSLGDSGAIYEKLLQNSRPKMCCDVDVDLRRILRNKLSCVVDASDSEQDSFQNSETERLSP